MMDTRERRRPVRGPLSTEGSDALPSAAQRALAEAAARRAERERLALENPRPKEVNGRAGPDPVRYGDWEVKGSACDF